MEQKWTTMATIQRTFERAEAEGLGVSKNLLRQLCLTNQISPVIVGKRSFLINWNNLLTYLQTGSVKPKVEAPDDGKIHRIEVR